MQLSKTVIPLKSATSLWRELKSFWSWWLAELDGMLPQRIRGLILPRRQRAYLDLDGATVILSHGTIDTMRPVATYRLPVSDLPQDPDSETVTSIAQEDELLLCLPQDKVLTKSVTLPLAAEENLREVLGFEMDRNTPFTSEQVYYDYLVTAREPKKNKITVDLIVTPRKVLDELLGQLAKLGLQPQRATIRHHDGDALLAVNLHPSGGHNGRTDKAQYVNLALVVLAILLLAGAIALPLIHKRNVVRSLETQLDATAQEAAAAQRLRDEVDRLASGSRFLLTKKQSTPLVLELLTELTTILPDDTWVTHIDIRRPEISIQGQSSSAAALIPLIESSSALSNARFRSPVTSIPRTDTERFHLSAETETEGAP